MANVMEKVSSSRGGAIAVGIIVAVIAAILLIVYITRYKSSVDSSAAAVPVLVAKNLIPKGTPGSVVATKQLYQSTSVPEDKVQSGAISDPNALNGRTAIADVYPGSQLTLNNFTAEASTALNAQLAGRERAVTITIDPVKGSLANVASGDKVDIYTQLERRGEDGDPALPRRRHRPVRRPAPPAGTSSSRLARRTRRTCSVRVQPDDAVLRRPPGLRRRGDRRDHSPTSRR